MTTEITRIAALDLATAWQRQGDDWHFHMLPPYCSFNDFGIDCHVVLLENHSKQENFFVSNKQSDIELGRNLAELVHSNVFESDSELDTASWFTDWKETISRFINDGRDWHHHMLFPNCILNEHSPDWVLAVEVNGDSPKLIRTFKTEPVAEFIEIERMVWFQ